MDLILNTRKRKIGIQDPVENEMAAYGLTVIRPLKGSRVLLAKNKASSALFTLKKIPEEDLIEDYKAMLEQFQLKRHVFKRLQVPDYHGRIGTYDVFEYAEGEMVPWSEELEEPGLGGMHISTKHIEPILDLSEELDQLGFWNGDFYWRNFVLQPHGKICVIDWDRIRRTTKGSESRICYLFCLMFENREWREKLVKHASLRGMIEKKSFRRKVIRTSSRFAEKWNHKQRVHARQMEINQLFKDEDQFKVFWKDNAQHG